MAILQSTTISGSNANTGSLQVTGSTVVFPIIESSLTSSFSGSGKMWINADTQNIQYSIQSSLGTVNSPARFLGAWSTANSMINARSTYGGGAGSQNAGLIFGGIENAVRSCTEEYDGTNWSAGGALISARRTTGAGTQNAANAVGGANPSRFNSTEEYDGSSWSSGGNTINTFTDRNVAGFQNATIAVGGIGNSPYPINSHTEEYNGSSWSAGTASPNNSFSGVGRGTQNDMMSLPGGQVNSGPAYGATREVDFYDGSAWSAGPDSLVCAIGGGGTGDTHQTMIFSAQFNDTTSRTNEFNGVSWVEADTLAEYMQYTTGVGTQAAGLAAGGYNPAQPTRTADAFEYTKNFIPPYTTNVWTSGATNILDKSGAKGAGDANAALSFGGTITPARVTCTEEYDGSSWSAGGAMIIAVGSHGGTGTQNAALSAGGEPATCTKSEEYNGSTWATGGNLSQGGYGNATLGTQNSALNFGGNFTGKKAETYNGSSWSTISDMNCCRRASGGGAGTTNAAIVFGGRCYTAPTTCQLTLSEEWNGSSWSFGGSYSICASDGVAGGETINTALSSGGYNPANPTGTFQTELYNGTSWSTDNYAIRRIKQAAGHSIGDSAFAVGGNPQTAASQFYEGACSTTLCSTMPVWSNGGALITGRHQMAGTGARDASLAIGGYTNSLLTGTEEYNGSAWSAGGTIITSRFHFLGAAGTQNAGLAFGGYPPASSNNATEEYDGSSWTSGGNLIRADRASQSFIGTQDAAVGAGGRTNNTCHEHYNGSSWSSQTASPANMACYAGSGTQNTFFIAGGQPTANTTTLTWNGTAWTSRGALINGVRDSSGTGDGNTAVLYGGRAAAPSGTTQCRTENFDGTSWSRGPNMPVAVGIGGQAGTATGASMISGYKSSSPYGITDHQFYDCVASTCVGAWSVGGSLINAKNRAGTFGTQNAAISALSTSDVESYNGTSWSAVNNMTVDASEPARAGTADAGIVFSRSPGCNRTQEWDGTNWSAGGGLITTRIALGGAGTQNAAVGFGGRSPSTCNQTEEYNGTSWASGNNMITGIKYQASAGTQNAAISIMGDTPAYVVTSEKYDGTNWSAGANSLFKTSCSGGSGTQNAAMVYAGYSPDASGCLACVQEFDGIAFSKKTPMIEVKRMFAQGAGSTTAQMASGGSQGPAASTSTEEYNCGANQILGAGLQCWIANVTMETE